jgi:6-pyruvoyltetrahydropterin/6-carboxytetrahydropterin synthase
MFELSITADFEAAHYIPNYPGKCSRLHGHNWRIEVCVSGQQLDQLGMVIDFHDLKTEVSKVTAKLDHYYLNEIQPFSSLSPTAENIAKFIYDELNSLPGITAKAKIRFVKVWESPNAAVTYLQEDNK